MIRLFSFSPRGNQSQPRTIKTTAFLPAAPERMEPRVVLSRAPHLAAVAVLAPPANLSPPWYTIGNELQATVGKTPGVKVGEVVAGADGSYTVTIVTRNHARGVALASVLTANHDLGGVSLKVEVKNPAGQLVAGVIPTSAPRLAQLERQAFAGNRLFQSVVVRQATPVPGSSINVFPVFKQAVVQFYNDNLADLYQNQNMVAAAAFADVLNLSPGGISVNPSTAR